MEYRVDVSIWIEADDDQDACDQINAILEGEAIGSFSVGEIAAVGPSE